MSFSQTGFVTLRPLPLDLSAQVGVNLAASPLRPNNASGWTFHRTPVTRARFLRQDENERRPFMKCVPPAAPRHQGDVVPSNSPSSFPSRRSDTPSHLTFDATAVNVELLQKQLKTDPTDSHAWLRLGQLLRKASGPNYAAHHMRQAVEALPSEPHLWHYYAQLAGQAFGTKKAVSILRYAVSQFPNNAAILAACASAEATLSNFKMADNLFSKAADIAPTDHVIFLQWAQAERHRRRFHRARAIYNRAVTSVPTDARSRIYATHAGLEAAAGKYSVARELYQLAAESNPKDKLIWQPWACMEERSGDIDRARQLFERAVMYDPTCVGSWQGWGLLEQRAGFFDVARQLFERGTLADPYSPLCWQAWASLEATRNNTLEARRLFEEGSQRVLDSTPASPLFIQWARVEEGVGEVELARRRFQTALSRPNEKTNDKIRVVHAWAGMERRAGQTEVARNLYRKASKMDNRDFRTLHAWAMLELGAGDIHEAHRLLSRCVRVAPRDASAVRALAQLEVDHFAHAGGLEKARSVLERAVSLRRYKDNLLDFWAELEEKHGHSEEAEQLRSMKGENHAGDNRREGRSYNSR